MFGTWDLVRPRYWHPMASLEQSMMDMDHMADLMFRQHSRFPFRANDWMLAAAPATSDDDDDFFNDLPVRDRQQEAETKPSTQQPAATDPTTPQPQQSNEAAQQGQQGQQGDNNNNNNSGRTFSTYSFSNSSIVDDKGRRVVSTRRRYEDSTGRLKAVHERQIADKKLRAVWNRMHKDDAGAHDEICENGTPEEFEVAWKQTPFGVAQEKEKEKEQQQQKKKKKITDKGEAADAEETPAADAS